MRGVSIIGTGSYLPEYRESNETFIDRTGMNTSAEWIEERTGIASRPLVRGHHLYVNNWVDNSEIFGGEFEYPAADMAALAVSNAAEMAEIDLDEIDLLMVGTWTPDMATPGTQDLTAQKLGINAAGADTSAACASFTYALANTYALLQADWNNYKTAAVVGTDFMSNHTNWHNRGNAFLFGDGAGAVILQRDDSYAGIDHYEGAVMGPETFDFLYEHHGETIEMQGQSVYKSAVNAATESMKRSLEIADIPVSEVGLFIPHQANKRITRAVQSRVGFSDEQTVDVIDHTANSSSATIPIGLDEAVRSGRLSEKDVLAMIGFGAGMTYATVVLHAGERLLRSK